MVNLISLLLHKFVHFVKGSKCLYCNRTTQCLIFNLAITVLCLRLYISLGFPISVVYHAYALWSALNCQVEWEF